MMRAPRSKDLDSDLWAARWLRSTLSPPDSSPRACALLLGSGSGHPLPLLRSLVAPGRVLTVSEPFDRGHGVGLLFGLVTIYASNPGAIVLAVPDSCELRRSQPTRDRLARAYLRTLRSPAAVVTVGRSLHAGITVARARALLDLYARELPDLVRLFCFHASLPVGEANQFLVDAYRGLPRLELVRILGHSGRLCGRSRHSVTDLRAQSGPHPPQPALG